MGLGYLILSIKSEQDKYLTGNPQFTFFKSVFKRHTNFAIDYQYINFTETPLMYLVRKYILMFQKMVIYFIECM